MPSPRSHPGSPSASTGGVFGPGHSAATPPTIAQVVSSLVTRFDADASATLSLSELLKVLDPAGTRTTLAADIKTLVTKIDTNADSSLSNAELTAAVKALDTDADGLIERSDRVAATDGSIDLMGVLFHHGDIGGIGC